jgi:hypothetical protein
MISLHSPCLVELYWDLEDFPTKKNFVMALGVPYHSLHEMYIDDYESEVARLLNTALSIDGQSTFEWACDNGMVDVAMKMLRMFSSDKSFTDESPFWDACKVDNPSVALKMVEVMTMQELIVMSGRETPLYIACARGKDLVVEKLIAKFGFDCEPGRVVPQYDATALLVANDCSVTTISLLVNTFGLKCNPGHILNNGSEVDDTALIVMCITGNPRKAMILLDAFGHHCKPEA